MQIYSLDDLNAYLFDRCLRRYQKLILENQPFSIAIDGREFPFFRCVGLLHANVLFFSSAEGGWHMLADGASNGYKIGDVIERNEPVHDEWFNREYLIDDACILVGQRNFAHFIWNQLAAFHRVSQERARTYYQVFDSFGMATEILGVAGTAVGRERLREFRNTLYVGCECLTAETAAVLARFLDRQMLNDPPPPEVANSRIIYIGVRGATIRELTNEVDFYTELLKALLERDPRCFFYLDGYSYTNSNRECEKAAARIYEGSARINQIIAGYGGSRHRVIHGRHLVEALSFIRHISFYVTHEGTMQHKVGWFYPNKKGVIVNGSLYQEATAQWHAAQVANAVPPMHLRDEHILPYRDGNRDSFFSILDVKGCVEYIASLILGSED